MVSAAPYFVADRMQVSVAPPIFLLVWTSTVCSAPVLQLQHLFWRYPWYNDAFRCDHNVLVRQFYATGRHPRVSRNFSSKFKRQILDYSRLWRVPCRMQEVTSRVRRASKPLYRSCSHETVFASVTNIGNELLEDCGGAEKIRQKFL